MTAQPSEPTGVRTGPLAGVRVLDLTRVLAGPWCTQCLADLGAEVLKVEAPGEGDETRAWGPPYVGEFSAYFTCANRSKASLVVDLKDPDGQHLVRRLATQADILIENFKLGAMEGFGLGYAALTALNPRLIFCSISGYGRTGPEAERAGYDFLVQAETGLMSATGFPDGRPTRVGVAVSDLFAGLYASQAILGALVRQRATGEGCAIDVSLFDCQLATLANLQASALATGQAPGRFGNAHPTVVPYEAFDAQDGVFVVALGNDRQFRRMCVAVLEDPGLAKDPLFANNRTRLANRVELSARLAAHFRRHPRGYWFDRFLQAGLPGGLLRTVDEALASPQAKERGLIHSFGEGDGALRVVRYPVKFDHELPEPKSPPLPGEGGAAVAERWLGASCAEQGGQLG